MSYIDTIKPKVDALKGDLAYPLQTRIETYQLFGGIDGFTSKYQGVMEKYYNVLANIESGHWEMVTIVNKAVPDIRSLEHSALVKAISLGVLCLFVYTIFVILYYQHEGDIISLLGFKSDDRSYTSD
jgi:hypothetical protein